LSSAAEVDISDWPQKSFEPVFNSHARHLVVYGGASAGKSYAVAEKLIVRALIYPKSRIVAIRKYGPSLRVTCFWLLSKLIDERKIPCNINKTDMSFHFPNGSTIQCMAIVQSVGESTERLKSLTDIDTIWLEEASNDINPEAFEMIKLRLRGQPLENNYRQIILTFNPIDENNWTNTYFSIERPGVRDDGAEVQHYTYKDNVYLDEEIKQELERLIEIDPNLYNIYTLGKYGRLENQVYSNWSEELFGYDYNDFDVTIAGVDFGWENPNAFVLLGIKERTLYVIDELYMRGTLNSKFIEEIHDKLSEHITDARLRSQIPIYCDSAEPSKIAEMKEANLNVHPAKKDVLDGISAVRQHTIIVNPRAEKFMKEIHGYTRQKDKDGLTMELPDKKRGFDHLMDAMRYAVYTWTLKQRRGGRVIMPQIVGEGEGRFARL